MQNIVINSCLCLLHFAADKVHDCRGVKSLNFVISLHFFEFYGEFVPCEYHISINLRVGKEERSCERERDLRKELWPIPTTAKNTVISPDFLVWKFCGKAQFPHQEIRRNYGSFHSDPEISRNRRFSNYFKGD